MEFIVYRTESTKLRYATFETYSTIKYNDDSHYATRSLMNKKSFEEIEGVKRKRNENKIRGNSAPFL